MENFNANTPATITPAQAFIEKQTDLRVSFNVLDIRTAEDVRSVVSAIATNSNWANLAIAKVLEKAKADNLHRTQKDNNGKEYNSFTKWVNERLTLPADIPNNKQTIDDLLRIAPYLNNNGFDNLPRLTRKITENGEEIEVQLNIKRYSKSQLVAFHNGVATCHPDIKNMKDGDDKRKAIQNEVKALATAGTIHSELTVAQIRDTLKKHYMPEIVTTPTGATAPAENSAKTPADKGATAPAENSANTPADKGAIVTATAESLPAKMIALIAQLEEVIHKYTGGKEKTPAGLMKDIHDLRKYACEQFEMLSKEE